MKHQQLRILLTAALLLGASAAGALSFVKASDEVLVDLAPVIVRAVARPLEREPAAGRMPLTFYALEVKSALRGAVPGEILELATPGGRDVLGFEAIIPGFPQLAAGEESLFFLERSPGGHFRLVLFNQGVFRIARHGGEPAAWRSFERGDEVVVEGRASEDERPRDLEKFEAWIADRIAGRQREADYRLAAAIQGELENAAQPFNIILWNGLPVRWLKGTSPLETSVYAHREPQPGIPGGGPAQVEASIAAWNGVDGGSLLRLRYAGLTDSIAGFHYNDGINAVVFDNFGNPIGDRPRFDCETQTGPIGWAYIWVAGTHSYGGREHRTIVSGDAVTIDWQCSPRFSIGSFEHTVGHELGHMLGMNHSCERNQSGPCSPAEREALMYWSSPGVPTASARLFEDDRRGIRQIYGPPAAPAHLRGEMSGERRVRLFWNDGSDNETGFAVYRESGGQNQLIGRLLAGATRLDDDDTRPATTYRYRVRAENENGLSSAAEFTITTPAIDTPAQLAATAAGPDAIALTWVDKAANETGYEVWGRFLGADELLATVPANLQNAAIEGLIADSTYTFKVRAVLPAGFTAFSNAASASTLPAPAEPCEDGGQAACLAGERFKVELRWKDFAGQRGDGTLAPAGSADSGVFYFFSPNNWEMLVKVLDGCAINGNTWVFAAGTTDVETTLIVTDSQTGKTAVYFNPLGTASPAVTDIAAFEGCAAGAGTPAPSPGVAPLCADGSGHLCLLDGRYRVKVTWTDFAGVEGQGQAVPAGTGDSGLLYFFSPDNWEMLVKVLDGCAINGKVWVFAAATTNVAYTLEVEDTVTRLTKTYENPLGKPSVAVTDIAAFDTCAAKPD